MQLRKFKLPTSMLVNFYTAIIESIVTSAIITWFPAAAAKDKAKLQRVIRSAERVIGCPLPPLGALFNSRALGRARKTLKTRHSHSFFPTAIDRKSVV